MVLTNLAMAPGREERHVKRLGISIREYGPVCDLGSSIEGDAKYRDLGGIWGVGAAAGWEKE